VYYFSSSIVVTITIIIPKPSISITLSLIYKTSSSKAIQRSVNLDLSLQT